MGVGGLLMFVLLTCFYYNTYLGIDIAIVMLITGIVCTARLLLSEHNNFEVYAGLIVGAICQLLSYWIAL